MACAGKSGIGDKAEKRYENIDSIIDRTLRTLKSFQVTYRAEPPVDDQTPDAAYHRFYLRNIAVRYEGDHGVPPLGRFWAHARRSGLPLGRSIETFFAERRWVRTHRYRFQTDVRQLTQLWGSS